MVTSTAIPQAGFKLTANQKRGFLAAWGGWALDGMDSFIYALVLVPALTELLPRSGIEATPANIGYYGSILFALFLFGWGTSMVWGPIGDRIGRVRALMLTILCYSLFTFLCGLVTSVWQLAFLRILCGIGIGGEQPVGATYIAEELDELDTNDAADIIAQSYSLEVSSPGVYRPLKKESDYRRYQGQRVEVTLYAPVNGRRHIKGTIAEVQSGAVVVEENEQNRFTLPLTDVAKATLDPELEI